MKAQDEGREGPEGHIAEERNKVPVIENLEEEEEEEEPEAIRVGRRSLSRNHGRRIMKTGRSLGGSVRSGNQSKRKDSYLNISRTLWAAENQARFADTMANIKRRRAWRDTGKRATE